MGEKYPRLFFNLCLQKFQFLFDEYGFKKKRKDTAGGDYSILFQNKTTAIVVGFEWRDQYIYVRLCRLSDGEFRKNPILITQDSELSCFDVEDLLTIRAPKMSIDSGVFGKALSDEEVERILTIYADAVNSQASDILAGDFSVWPELDGIVKSRIRELNA